MADLSDINIGINVEAGDVTKAISKFESFKRKTAQLKLELDKGNISTKAYNRGVDQMARELGKVTGNINQAKSAMYKYQFAIKDATEEQLRFTTASGKGMRRMEVLAQQAGYQIGDLAVQIQSGTNAAVALGQQGSQLLGFFGPYGALAGAALAIGTGLIAPFIRAGKEVETFAEEAEQALQDVKDKIDELETGRNSILRGYDEETARLRVLGREQADALQAKIDTAAAQGLAAGDAELYSKRERRALRETFDAIRANLAKRKEYSDELEKLTKKEEQKKAEGKVSPEEKAQSRLNRSRWAAFQAQMAAAKKRQEEENKIKAIFEEQSRVLGDQIALEAMRKQFGSESFVIQRLQNDIALDNYEVELRRQGLNEKMIASLVEQKSVALGLKQEMIEMAALAQTTLNFAPTQELASRLRKYAGRGTVSDKDPVFGTGPRAGKSIYGEPPKAPKAPKDALVSLMEDLELQRELLGVEEDRASVLQALGENRSKYTQDQIQQAVDATNAIRLQTEELEKQERVADTISQSFGDAFMSIVDGTMSAKDAFRSMAADIIRELYRILVVETMVQSIKRSIFPFADGGVIQGGKQVQAYANGGVVGGPTYFPMAGGKTGLMGEAGPEAIMPLKRGKGGKLGVEVSGDTGAVNIVQNFSFAANGDESVKKIIAEAAPKIANMTQQQIMDARRRGGQMRSTFG